MEGCRGHHEGKHGAPPASHACSGSVQAGGASGKLISGAVASICKMSGLHAQFITGLLCVRAQDRRNYLKLASGECMANVCREQKNVGIGRVHHTCV
mmetsp:Transcript_15145/g.41009  ORF Transcript_15145/g.41009 Transcript_15145/m.41009 type:complete len:97 (+) Transcript_15145:1135-1425(+)